MKMDLKLVRDFSSLRVGGRATSAGSARDYWDRQRAHSGVRSRKLTRLLLKESRIRIELRRLPPHPRALRRFDRPNYDGSSNLVTQIAFTTTSADGLQTYLAANGVKTGKITPVVDETDGFEATDPENHRIASVQRRDHDSDSWSASEQPPEPRRICRAQSPSCGSFLQGYSRLPPLLARRNERRQNKVGGHASS